MFFLKKILMGLWHVATEIWYTILEKYLKLCVSNLGQSL